MNSCNFLFTIAILGISCFSACVPGKVIKLSDSEKVILLDSASAAKAIVVDDVDNFFDKISITDMSLQLRKNYKAGTLRGRILYEYKNFLRADVAGFDKKEKRLVKAALKDAFKMVGAIDTAIFPNDIQLIKTHGQHYGPGVFYTRENRIVIPKDALATGDKNRGKVQEALTNTLIHEIFHIYSRYHPKERRELYGLIGFKNMFGLPVIMDKPLQNRLLLNPDGVNIVNVINVKTDSSTISAIPLVFASQTNYEATKPSFFSYLQFNLYQVVRKGSAIRVISDNKGFSTLDMKELPDYFRQIKNNTEYVIHPDEILADNFLYLAQYKRKPSTIERFSPGGQALIKEMEAVLKRE